MISSERIVFIMKGESPVGGWREGAPQVLLAPYLLYQCEGVQREGIDPDEFPNVDVMIRIRVMEGCCVGPPILV